MEKFPIHFCLVYLKFEGMPNISDFFLWSSEKYRVYHVLKIRNLSYSTLDIQYTINALVRK
jgi:hypothetical protein